jgi:hypothetical protein
MTSDRVELHGASAGGERVPEGYSLGESPHPRPLPVYPRPTEEELREVDQLPRRTAHAVHGLLVASREHGMPVTAVEVMVFDEEALSVQATARGLSDARRRGLASFTGKFWIPTPAAENLRRRFEDRFLDDTKDGLQCP